MKRPLLLLLLALTVLCLPQLIIAEEGPAAPLLSKELIAQIGQETPEAGAPEPEWKGHGYCSNWATNADCTSVCGSLGGQCVVDARTCGPRKYCAAITDSERPVRGRI